MKKQFENYKKFMEYMVSDKEELPNDINIPRYSLLMMYSMYNLFTLALYQAVIMFLRFTCDQPLTTWGVVLISFGGLVFMVFFYRYASHVLKEIVQKFAVVIFCIEICCLAIILIICIAVYYNNIEVSSPFLLRITKSLFG